MTKTTMQNKSLYDVLGMKGKNSIFKSVFITDRKTAEGYPIVEVEPFDDTFLNAIKYPSGYDKTIDRIKLKVFNHFSGENVWLSVYTDHGHHEHLLSQFHMKEICKLI